MGLLVFIDQVGHADSMTRHIYRNKEPPARQNSVRNFLSSTKIFPSQ